MNESNLDKIKDTLQEALLNSSKSSQIIKDVSQEIVQKNGGTVDMTTAVQALTAKASHNMLSFLKKILNVFKIVGLIKDTVTGLQMFVVSIVILILCIAFFALIYYIARVVRIRWMQPGHTENMGEFMRTFHKDIDDTRKRMTSIMTFKGVYDLGNGSNLIDMLECSEVSAYIQSLNNSSLQALIIDTYFKYKDVFVEKTAFKYYDKDVQHIKDIICKTRGNEEYHKFVEQQNACGMKSEEYLEKVILMPFERKLQMPLKKSIGERKRASFINEIMSVCLDLTEEQYNSQEKPNIITSSSQQVKEDAANFISQCKSRGIQHKAFRDYCLYLVELCISLQLLQLYTNTYYQEIKQLHNNRRFGFFNLLMMMIVPYYKTLIEENVVRNWRELFSKKGRDENYKQFQKKWNSIGTTLKNLPRTLARAGGENFKEEEQKEDIIEGFGFLKGLLSIGDFFLALLDVAKGVAKLVTRPLDMLMYIFKMVIGLVVGLVLIVLYTLLTLPPFIYIIYGLYFFVVNIVVNAVFSAFWIGLFAVFALQSVVIWAIDLMFSAMTGFKSHSFLVWFVRCENLPNIWHTRANFVEGNKFTRSFSCQRPCASRFTPNQFTCSRIYEQQPSFCPQAQVARIYQGIPTKAGPYHMENFKPSIYYHSKTKEEKQDEVRRFYEKRQDFLEKCGKMNEPYVDYVKNICANYDTIKLPDESLRPQLEIVCKQVFCDGNKKQDFCHKFKSPVESKNISKGTVISADDVVSKILNLCIMIIIIIIVLLMFAYSTKE